MPTINLTPTTDHLIHEALASDPSVWPTDTLMEYVGQRWGQISPALTRLWDAGLVIPASVYLGREASIGWRVTDKGQAAVPLCSVHVISDTILSLHCDRPAVPASDISAGLAVCRQHRKPGAALVHIRRGTTTIREVA